MQVCNSYDVIVVGAGSSGCVVAGRLSAARSLRVLLIEAGGANNSPFLKVPAGYYRMLQTPNVDWGDITLPEPGLSGRRISQRHGKVMGGGSSVNGMVYVRGAAEDYDGWAARVGSPEWSYESVLPLFKRSEHNYSFDNRYHGISGPLAVSFPPYRNAFADAFVEASVSLSMQFNPDFNGVSQEGAGFYQLTGFNSRRSSATDFLNTLNEKLTICTNRTVTRILIENERAVGVEVMDENGKLSCIVCERDVVLSAGAIGSPCLLLRSGIGSAATLQRIGVPVVVDNPDVGRHLQDHIQVKVVVETNPANSLNGHLEQFRDSVGLMDDEDPAVSVAAGLAGLFVTTTDQSTPDIQFHVLPFGEESPGRLHAKPCVTVSVCLLRPKARGNVTVKSADWDEKPCLVFAYLSTPEDMQPLRDGLRLLGRILERMGSQVCSILSPAPLNGSDSDLNTYIRNTASTIFHPSSSCVMAQRGGVVDSELRIRGIRSLRVADASVMPTIVSGNTNAACFMIGERAADLIMSASSNT